MTLGVAVVWKSGPVAGTIEVAHGRLTKASAAKFACAGRKPCRVELAVSASSVGPGPESPVVTVRALENPFSFFLRDVRSDAPILIAAYGVAVLPAGDSRTYAQVEADVRARGLRTKLQQIETEPEESFETAAAVTRKLRCPTWLGLSRDMRIFELDYESDSGRWSSIQPRFHGYPVTLPETADQAARYIFFIGRGVGPVRDVTRRLEEGVLPILRTRIVDEDIRYECTAFAAPERSDLTATTLRGTHFLVADGYGRGNMLTPEQKAQREALLPGEMARDEETVLWQRIEAVNTAATPRYAWFKTIHPGTPLTPNAPRPTYDPATGFSAYSAERVFGVSLLDGKPAPAEEFCVLIQPGEKAVFEMRLPHRPIPPARARALAAQGFARRHRECRAFWKARLDTGARLRLPETRLDEMVRAGLLHLDLVTYGLEPKGTLTPCIGVYCPIGSESSPIVQFIDAMGRHDIARRALMYFMDKQHEDGFIQNFGNYMLETGPALWSIGEHWRLTGDDAWVRSIRAKLVKSCDYMIAWRRRNLKPEFRGRGYGMMDGKVADPVDPYHIFMLNGYAYLGMSRVAEMLARIDPRESARIRREAEALKKDVRAAFFESMAKSPVVPLGDGTWTPTCAPWAEAQGPLVFFVNKTLCFTHGTFLGRDSMLGPIYLVLQEVLAPTEPGAEALVNVGAEHYHQRNGAFSQPYYSPHLHVNLMRDEVKAFLKGYYTTVSALADRETYTFWEHLYHVSPHKTHEEGWFLLQTRHMLWSERGDTLRFLPAVPRAWLADGKSIDLEDVATYFGPATLRVRSSLATDGVIRAEVECASKRRPAKLEVRLPHPDGLKPARVTGGVYDRGRECVRVERFTGKAAITVEY